MTHRDATTHARGRFVLDGDMQYLLLSDGRTFNLEDLLPQAARPLRDDDTRGPEGFFYVEVRWSPMIHDR